MEHNNSAPQPSHGYVEPLNTTNNEAVKPSAQPQALPASESVGVALPVPKQQAKVNSGVAPAALPTNDNPLVAADDDLIEKEWVDRAKKIVSETKHDPYRQEQQVSQLQADYLKKRYGKEVKVTGE